MLNLGGGAVAAIVVYAFVRPRHAQQAQQRL
jgi:hypothetical protein